MHRYHVYGLAVLLAAALGVGVMEAQKPPPRVTVRAPRGRVSVYGRDHVPRLPGPVVKPPADAPAYRRPGHHWRWHRHHGWLLVPRAVSPGAVLLPEGYRLPEEVLHYDADAGAGACRCPHCGKPVTLTAGGGDAGARDP